MNRNHISFSLKYKAGSIDRWARRYKRKSHYARTSVSIPVRTIEEAIKWAEIFKKTEKEKVKKSTNYHKDDDYRIDLLEIRETIIAHSF